MGKVLNVAADGTTTVDKEVSGFVEKMFTGVSAMFAGEDKAYTGDIVLAGQIPTNVANTIATSMFTRKRAADGKAPMFKILF